MKSSFRFALALLALAAAAPIHAQSLPVENVDLTPGQHVTPDPLQSQLRVVGVGGTPMVNRTGTGNFLAIEQNTVILSSDRVLMPNPSRLDLVLQPFGSTSRTEAEAIHSFVQSGTFSGQQIIDQLWAGGSSSVNLGSGSNPAGGQNLLRTTGTVLGGAIAGGLGTGVIKTSNSSVPPDNAVSD